MANTRDIRAGYARIGPPWPRGPANPARGPGPRTGTTHGEPGPLDRRRLIFRGNAANTNCSPRYLNANNRPSNSNVNIGCSAQGWISHQQNFGRPRCPEEANIQDKATKAPAERWPSGYAGHLPRTWAEYHVRGR